jgi:hypothetical protein
MVVIYKLDKARVSFPGTDLHDWVGRYGHDGIILIHFGICIAIKILIIQVQYSQHFIGILAYE